MKQTYFTLTTGCFPSRKSPAGFALLGYCYLIVIWIMVLTTSMLTRGSQELRNAERSVDLNHAFWVSEAGLDTTVNQIRTGAVSFDTQGSFLCGAFSVGDATCWIELVSMAVGEGGVLETIYQITSEGRTTRTGTAQRVMATIRTQQTFSGVLANRGVDVNPNYEGWVKDRPITIKGDIRSAWGKVKTVYLGEGVTIDGEVVIGQRGDPDGLNPYGPMMMSYNRADNPGIYLERGFALGDLKDAQVGDVSAQSMEPLRPAAVPPECTGQVSPLVVREGEKLHIRDGSPLDLSPAGDGRVVICASYVTIWGDRWPPGRVIFHDPTVLYVTNIKRWYFDLYSAFYNDGTISVARNLQDLPDHGLTVVVIPPPGKTRAGDVTLGKFKGSVYAPASDIDLYIGEVEWGEDGERAPKPKRELGFLVGRDLFIEGCDLDFRQRPAKGKTKQQPPTPGTSVTLMSWMTAPASGTTP